MKQFGKALTWAWLAAILLALVATYAPSADAAVHAAAQRQNASATSSYTLTLSITNGSTFAFDSSPGARFHLVLQPDPTASSTNFTALLTLVNTTNSAQQQITINPFYGPDANGAYTADQTNVRDSSGNPLSPGAYTASATITSSAGAGTTSNQVSFTITKLNLNLSCGLDGSIYSMWKPGQNEQVTLSATNTDSNYPVNWTQGAGNVSVWFTGANNTLYRTDGLTPDSAGNVTVTTPPQVGWYSLNCSFPETTYYTAATTYATNKDLLISQMLKFSAIQLYTNPTTYTGTQTTQMYVVLKPAPGAPMPTGQLELSVGTYRMYIIGPVNVGSNGETLITVKPLSGSFDSNTINLLYFGDTTYDRQSVNFPLTNPAIPSGATSSSTSTSTSASSGSSGSTSGATSASATTTPQATTTVGSAGAGSPATSATPSSQPAAPAPTPGILSAFGPLSWTNGALWLVALAVLLALGAGGGTFYWLSRRRGDATGEPLAQDIVGAPMRPPAGSPQDDVTMPMRRTDRP